MKNIEQLKLKDLPLLPYVIDGEPKILSLNDTYIRKGDNLHRKDEIDIAAMYFSIAGKYYSFKSGTIEKDDMISHYKFIVGQLESQLLDKEEVYDFINNLNDEQFKQLENQANMFYEIHLLSQK